MKKMISRRELLRRFMLVSAGSLAACSRPESPTVERETPQTNVTGPSQAKTPPENSDQSSKPAAEKPTETSVGPASDQAYLAVARGDAPAAITEAAIKALGGIERFVKNGYDVIIKPNICTDYYTFEYGATTNPAVVATLVRLAFGAGAKRVRVMDYPFGGTAESAYAKSGIADAVKEVGGAMELMNYNKFRMTAIPEGKSITEWEIYQEVLNCDLLINVPIAKDHSLARITVGGKNLLGVISQRSSIHAQMGERIADLISVLRPGLTVVDAVRTLMRHGPTGGNLDDVKINNTVIASHDIVAADAYAAGLFELTGADIPYIKASADRGLGTMDLSGLKLEELTV